MEFSLLKNVPTKCSHHLPIGPKMSCLISLLYGNWSAVSLRNLPGVWRLVLKDRVSMVLWMIVVLDSGLGALVTVTAQMFGRTQVCFNDVLVWPSLNPPAVIWWNTSHIIVVFLNSWSLRFGAFHPIMVRFTRKPKNWARSESKTSACVLSVGMLWIWHLKPVTASSGYVKLLV